MESNIFLHLHGIFFNQFKEERELMETGLEDRLIEGGQHTGKREGVPNYYPGINDTVMAKELTKNYV